MFPTADSAGRVERRPDPRSRALLGLHLVPPAAARGDGRDPRPSRLGGRAADRRRQVALLPGAGAGAPGAGRGRIAAHLADEGSGRHARRQRRAGGALQQHAQLADEKTAVSAGLREGRYRLLYVSPERLAGEGSDGFLATLVASATCSSSRSTRPTASASGGTISGRSIASWAGCATCFRTSASTRLPRRRRPACGVTSRRSSA